MLIWPCPAAGEETGGEDGKDGRDMVAGWFFEEEGMEGEYRFGLNE
jgi:hypothetical protein